MAVNKKLLQGAAAAAGGLVPSEHFGVMLYEGDGSSSHSINGGKFGAAGFFENAGVIQIPDNITNTNEHSFSVWFNVNDASGNQTLLEIDTGNRIIFRIASTDANKANFGNGGWFNHGLSFSANQWYHLAITFKSGSPAKIYVDGSLQYTTGNISKASFGSNNYLGAANGSGSGSVQGKIDQFRVFQKELSSSEVSTLYAETAPESLDPLSEDTTDTLQVLGDSSCVATYRFENDEVDLSGNYDGTGTQIQYAAGRYGQAASFNGSSSYINPNGDWGVNGDSSHSVSFWVNFNSSSGTQHFYGIGDIVTAFTHTSLYIDSGLNTVVHDNNGNADNLATSLGLSTGQWYHFVLVYDTAPADAIIRLYIDNVSKGTVTKTLNVTGDAVIGRRPYYATNYLNADLDQFRVFNKALSASEVTTLYQENSLVASYRFEGNANDDTRNYDGTASNVTYEYGLNGFTPDLVWIKIRDAASNHVLIDSTRGVQKYIGSNTTTAEATSTDQFTSFDTGGFTLGANAGAGGNTNQNGNDYVAWCFKANGGTTSSNTDGSITSTVQVNDTAGFSIVKWTSASSGSSYTVGHGLDTAPDVIIFKYLGISANWIVYHTGISGSATNKLFLDLTNAATSYSDFPSATPTDSTFSMGSASIGGYDLIAYCFKNVDGFSKFGSYTGNGSSNIIETGFEPAFIMFKRTDAANNWLILDNKRNTSNPRNCLLIPNSNSVEDCTDAAYNVNFLSNGFELLSNGTSINDSGGTYIYMAFAADPDTEAPTVAKSFTTVAYTGDGTSNRQIDLGFKPGLFWQKTRATSSSCTYNNLFDIVRGGNKTLYSNVTSAEVTNQGCGYIQSFDDYGVTYTGDASGINNSGEDFVIWAWKADDNEPTITQTTADIDALAIYKFEDNTNDVTGNFNASSTSNITYNASGKFNKSAIFNGSSSTITLPIATSDLGTNSACSISWWWKPNTSGTTIDFLFEANAADVFMIHTGGGAGSQGLRVGVKNTSETAFQLDVTNAYTTGVWQHHVATFGNGKIKLYENGNLIGSLDYNGTIKTISNIAIGNRPSNPYWYSGELDQVRIYNGELDAASVTNLYNETTSQNNTLDIGTDENTSIEAIVSANANAGFSIVQWEGTGTQTQIPHGLSAAPEMIISKRLDSTNNWSVYHKDLSLSHTTYPNWLYLNLTSSEQDSASSANHPYYAAPSSTVIYQNTGTSESTNVSGGEYISYCFHSVSNFSKIGTFTGTGTGTNQLINTGFQPDWVMFKDYSAGGSWWIQDSPRGSSKSLKANSSDGESTTNYVTFESNGFRVSGDANGTSDWIYMAFKIN